MLNRLLLALVATAAACSVAHAQYKWTDASGRVVYGDNPPRDARNVQRIDARGASGEADALAGLPFESRRAAQAFPVVLYTTSNCPPCDAGRELLRARGVPYAERTVSSKEDSEQLEKLGLGNKLPVLTIGRQAQREFQTGAWHAALSAAGYPGSAQLPRSWQATTTPLVSRPSPSPAPAAPTEEERPTVPRTN